MIGIQNTEVMEFLSSSRRRAILRCAVFQSISYDIIVKTSQ